MNIYLAARYSRHEEMQQVALALVEQGHSITSRWIWGHYAAYDATLLDPGNRALVETIARHDVEDVCQAECVIMFTEAPGMTSRGGRHVEWGLGLAWGKRLILIGQPEHLFHCLPQVEVYAGVDEICWDHGASAMDTPQAELTGKEFQAIRKQTLHLSVKACAELLGIKPQTVRNIESGNKRCGRQMSMVMRLRQQQTRLHTTPHALPGPR